MHVRSVRDHFLAGLDFQNKLVRFLENHDEPRAAAAFSLETHRPAAIITYLTPGLRFFHQGQFEGRKNRWIMLSLNCISHCLSACGIRPFGKVTGSCLSAVPPGTATGLPAALLLTPGPESAERSAWLPSIILNTKVSVTSRCRGQILKDKYSNCVIKWERRFMRGTEAI